MTGSVRASWIHGAVCNIPNTITGTVKMTATIRRRRYCVSAASAGGSVSGTPYPSSSIALMKSATRTRAGSNSTVAMLVARLTLARVTPLVEARVRSIERAQPAQVMPETGRSMRSAVFMWRTKVGKLKHAPPRSARLVGHALACPDEPKFLPPKTSAYRLCSSRHLVAQLPHRVGQRFGCHHPGVVFHDGFGGVQVHRRFRHAARAGP